MLEIRRAEENIAALEAASTKNSPLNRVHTRIKLLVTLVYIVCVVSFPRFAMSGIAAFILYPAILLPLSNISAGTLVKRVAPALPFALMGGIANIILLKEPIFAVGSVIISAGMVSCAVILVKTVFCVAAALILIGSTPFFALCAELKRLHVPAIFCVQLFLMYRYITVLLATAAAMRTAYLLRSPDRAVRMKDMGAFVGRLFLRSVDKAERVYNAMKCRGWSGFFHTPRQNVRPADYFFGATACGLILFLRFFDISLFFGSIFSC